MWGEDDAAPEMTRATPEEAATIPEVKYEYLDHPADVQIHAWGSELREAYEQAAMGMFGYMTDLETVDIEAVQEVEAEAEDLEGLLFHFLDECLFVFSCDPFFVARKVEITEWAVGGGAEMKEEEREGETEKGKEEEEGEMDREEEGEVKEGDKPKDSKGAEGRESGEEVGDKSEENEEEKEEEEGSEEGNNMKKIKTGKEEAAEPVEEIECERGGGGDGTGGEGTSGTEGHGRGGGGGGEVGDSGSGVYRIRARLFGEEFQLGKHPQGTEVKAITYASMQVYSKPGQHEVFVIVDI